MTDYLEQLLELVEREEDEEIRFPDLCVPWRGEKKDRQSEHSRWTQQGSSAEKLFEEREPPRQMDEGEEILQMARRGAEGGERPLPLRREYELPWQQEEQKKRPVRREERWRGVEQEETARGTVLTAGSGVEREDDARRKEVQAEEDRPALLRLRLTRAEGQTAYRQIIRRERTALPEPEKRSLPSLTAGSSGWEARQVDRVFERDARRYDNRFTLF